MPQVKQARPNILLITTDQQRSDTISAWGNERIYTPHFNWLADEGLSFTRCYADCPVCMPSRATIMTGLAGYSLGLLNNNASIHPLADHPTLPALLTAAGYQTHAQGKMHFEPFRAHYGFEEMELPADYFREKRKYGCPTSKQTGVGENEMEPVVSPASETDSLTWWTVDRSIDFLETRDGTRPFFLWTSFSKPHPPFECPLNYWALYQNVELPEPLKGDWIPPAGMAAPTWKLNDAWRLTPMQLRESMRAYYACITQIDYNLGRLFARMREMNLLENTWILFTSDHGDMMGDFSLGAKGTFFEGSAHVPLLIRPPMPSKGHKEFSAARCDELVTLADIMPTILTIAGERTPEVDGRDLMQIHQEKISRPFFGICGSVSALHDGRFKYCFTNAGGDELLFDMVTDPHETKNLAVLPEYAAIKMQARKALTEKLQANVPAYLGVDGQLTSKTERPINSIRWPGFHSVFSEADVLH
ncbi:MAG: sulfatase-like hydrolase/transferase [Eubacteriales bacterium]|nr:sulfatase-like hydrolase/transferase [Eubacteriales bacterium]